MYTMKILLMGMAFITMAVVSGSLLTLLAGMYIDRKIDERIAEENDD